VEVVVRRDDQTIRLRDEAQGPVLAFLMFLIPGFPKDILCYISAWTYAQRPFSSLNDRRLLGRRCSRRGTFLRDERYGAFFTLLDQFG